MAKHTLSVLVENRPGTLSRVAGLFSRRGFNIDSLAVGPTEVPEISRITIVVDAADQPLEQVTKQLNKLIPVLKIVELDSAQAVDRELWLIKVHAPGDVRNEIISIANVFRASIVDVHRDTVVVEATGSTDKLHALLAMLEPFGVRELVRSGVIAVGRGSKSITEGRSLRSERNLRSA